MENYYRDRFTTFPLGLVPDRMSPLLHDNYPISPYLDSGDMMGFLATQQYPYARLPFDVPRPHHHSSKNHTFGFSRPSLNHTHQYFNQPPSSLPSLYRYPFFDGSRLPMFNPLRCPSDIDLEHFRTGTNPISGMPRFPVLPAHTQPFDRQPNPNYASYRPGIVCPNGLPFYTCLEDGILSSRSGKITRRALLALICAYNNRENPDEPPILAQDLSSQDLELSQAIEEAHVWWMKLETAMKQFDDLSEQHEAGAKVDPAKVGHADLHQASMKLHSIYIIYSGHFRQLLRTMHPLYRDDGSSDAATDYGTSDCASEAGSDRSAVDDWGSKHLKSEHQVPELMHRMADYFIHGKKVDRSVREALQGIVDYGRFGQRRDWSTRDTHGNTCTNMVRPKWSDGERLVDVAAEYVADLIHERSLPDEDLLRLAHRLIVADIRGTGDKHSGLVKTVIKTQFALQYTWWLYKNELSEGIGKTLALWIDTFDDLMSRSRGARKKFYEPFAPFNDENTSWPQFYMASQLHSCGRAWVDFESKIDRSTLDLIRELKVLLDKQRCKRNEDYDAETERCDYRHDHSDSSDEVDEDIPALLEDEAEFEGVAVTSVGEGERIVEEPKER